MKRDCCRFGPYSTSFTYKGSVIHGRNQQISMKNTYKANINKWKTFKDKIDFHDRMQKEAKKVWRDHFVFKSGPMNSVKTYVKIQSTSFLSEHWNMYTKSPKPWILTLEKGSGNTSSPCYVPWGREDWQYNIHVAISGCVLSYSWGKYKGEY